jgi:DNA-binding transcriptional LysR family regulator
MDIDLLKTFVAICDTHSFTAAAQQVGRTQSAVSLQVKRLEDSLGRPLFVRGTGPATLTEHGVLLLPAARRILATVNETLAAFGRSAVDSVIVLGMPDDYASRYLEPVMIAFAELYPLATLNMVIDESRTLVRRLAEGSVDMAFITEHEGPTGGGPVAFRDSIVWVTSEDDDAHLADPLPLAVWDEDDGYSRRMFAALADAGRAYHVAIASRSMTGLKAAARSGLAVTAMMSTGVGPGLRVLSEAEGFPPLGAFDVRLERAHQRRSPVLDKLQERLIEGIAALRVPD